MVELIWAPSAVRDLENIAKFIENYSPQAARMQIQKLFRRSLFIQNNPGAGRPVPELKDSVYRQSLEGRYRIIYKFEANVVQILTIHHQSMLPINNPAFPV